MLLTLMFIQGLRDFNNLRARDIEARADTTGDLEEEITNDPYCQEEHDNDPHFVDEIATINKDLEEMEKQMKQSEQCGVFCSKTIRLPCVAHKASDHGDLITIICISLSLKCFSFFPYFLI